MWTLTAKGWETHLTEQEHFRDGDAARVYRRFRDHGRLAPEGLTYVSSWVDEKLERCYQLMETEDRRLLDQWMASWSDIVDFEVHAVISSAEAAERLAPDCEPGRPGLTRTIHEGERRQDPRSS